MNRRLTDRVARGFLVLLVLMPWSGVARAAGDVAAGARVAIYCAYCHGLDGNPGDPGVPRLAGQAARRLLARIKTLEGDGEIHGAMLKALRTGNIGERELVDLAAYYQSAGVGCAGRGSLNSPDACARNCARRQQRLTSSRPGR